MWDLLLVAVARLVTALAQPVLRWRARTEGPRQRKRIASMATTPMATAPAGARVRVGGTVEAAPAGGPRARAFVVRDDDGARALVQPASAAGIWSGDGAALDAVAPGDRVDVVGVARPPDARVDRELGTSEARLVFAGSEAAPLFIIRR